MVLSSLTPFSILGFARGTAHTFIWWYNGCSHIAYILCLRSKLWKVIVHTPSFWCNSTTSSSSLNLFWLTAYRLRMAGDCAPSWSQDEGHYPAVLGWERSISSKRRDMAKWRWWCYVWGWGAAQGKAGHSVTQGGSWQGLCADKETGLGNASKVNLSDFWNWWESSDHTQKVGLTDEQVVWDCRINSYMKKLHGTAAMYLCGKNLTDRPAAVSHFTPRLSTIIANWHGGGQ